eukprot:s2532_g17.t1
MRGAPRASKWPIAKDLNGRRQPDSLRDLLGLRLGSRSFRSSIAMATKAGFCFDNQGHPYSIKDIQSAARDLFQGLVEPLEGLTTYSFRRLMPTVGHMLEFSEEEMLALGDWTDHDKSKAAMPHLYSAARYTQSVRVKHRVYCAIAQLAEYEAWEVIPRTALSDADAFAQQEVDRKLQQDLTVVWVLPPDAVQLQAHFRLSEELTAAAKKKRSSDQGAAAGDPMPAELRGYVLTQTLKDGSRLCTAFNTANCQHGDRCADRHLCAVVLQTGRACGGKHPASACWGRRAMKVERFQEMRPGSVPSAKEEEPPTRDEADTSDESSSSSMAVTAPQPAPAKPKTPAEAASAKRSVKAKASPVAADHPKGPAKRAERPPSPKQPPKKKARQEAPSQAAGSDPAAAPQLIPIPDMVPLGAADRRFDQLATVSGKQTEMPSLVLQRGELWISGIPTEQTKHHFPAAQFCKSAVWRSRLSAALFPLVRRSLFQGDTVLFHCVAGRHRAAVAGTVVYAIMGRCNIKTAEEGILKRRPIKLQQAFQDRGLADWAHRTVATTTLAAPLPKATAWAATDKSHVHIMTDNEVPLCAHKQGESRPRALKDPYVTVDKYEALAWSLPFCAGCRDRAPASFLWGCLGGWSGPGSPEKRLRKLGEQFTLDRVVVEALIKEKIQDLEEFRFFFDCETKVEKWMSKLSLGEEANIQAARVRRAWNAVSLYYKNFETDRSKVSTTDLDSLLDGSELRTHKQNFWVRYKLRFPTEQYPSDATVSRVTRELDKRMLCVNCVWKVKSLQCQLMTANKKRKLGDGLFTEEPELEEPGPKMWSTTSKGCIPSCLPMPWRDRPDSQDIEERSEWVSKYRESTRTLGTIVKESCEARDAQWVVVASTESPGVAAPTAQSSAPDSAASHFQMGQKVNGKAVAKTMRDGTALCPAFQQGNCKHKGASCPKGAHKCGVVTKGQRICNSANHASTCSTKASLGPQLAGCDFVAAALDCSTKSRAREIPRVFEDGRKAPGPLRSDRYPEGLPNLRTQGEPCQKPALGAAPQEKAMMASGCWFDTDYSACVFNSARAKSQRLRHNIQEIADWTNLQCHHIHAEDEWTPFTHDGVRVYPSKEEAEYSACLAFSIAVAASWWAVRTGRAALAVPRMPPTEAVGRRAHWLDFDPRSMRQWALAPLAISLGLLPLDAAEAARVPRRGRVTAVLKDGALPPWARAITATGFLRPSGLLPQCFSGRVAPQVCGVGLAQLVERFA